MPGHGLKVHATRSRTESPCYMRGPRMLRVWKITKGADESAPRLQVVYHFVSLRLIYVLIETVAGFRVPRESCVSPAEASSETSKPLNKPPYVSDQRGQSSFWTDITLGGWAAGSSAPMTIRQIIRASWSDISMTFPASLRASSVP